MSNTVNIMTSEEFKQSEILKMYLPPFGGPFSDFDRGCAHGYSEGFDAAIEFVTNISKNVTEEDEWMNTPIGEPKE